MTKKLFLILTLLVSTQANAMFSRVALAARTAVPTARMLRPAAVTVRTFKDAQSYSKINAERTKQYNDLKERYNYADFYKTIMSGNPLRGVEELNYEFYRKATNNVEKNRIKALEALVKNSPEFKKLKTQSDAKLQALWEKYEMDRILDRITDPNYTRVYNSITEGLSAIDKLYYDWHQQAVKQESKNYTNALEKLCQSTETANYSVSSTVADLRKMFGLYS